ncbi:unnamed protein product [Lactuca saligna]|uniref:Uncharacterized protein n=1 Tax=Lactuca saligna TaxID=75948 RepID=A0AA36E9F2_LACSI|nr:unnamed protein product [Lactuca saligna]
MDPTTHLVAHGGPAAAVTSNSNNTAKPHSVVDLGGYHGEHVITSSGAATAEIHGEAATIEVIPMVAAAGDLCSDLVSNKALGQKGGARLLASLVLLVGD